MPHTPEQIAARVAAATAARKARARVPPAEDYPPTYISWKAMRQRCRDPNHERYKSYGGRGIKVCARWNDLPDGFANFLADMGERPEGTSIGRFGDTGNYEPGNCAWMSSAEQAANKKP